MEELTALRHCLENRDYEAAMRIVEEMEEMSREDKINKIGSFIKVLLIHLIKQHAENRTTR
jgi:pentatricopeptide repeat protein